MSRIGGYDNDLNIIPTDALFGTDRNTGQQANFRIDHVSSIVENEITRTIGDGRVLFKLNNIFVESPLSITYNTFVSSGERVFMSSPNRIELPDSSSTSFLSNANVVVGAQILLTNLTANYNHATKISHIGTNFIELTLPIDDLKYRAFLQEGDLNNRLTVLFNLVANVSAQSVASAVEDTNSLNTDDIKFWCGTEAQRQVEQAAGTIDDNTIQYV